MGFNNPSKIGSFSSQQGNDNDAAITIHKKNSVTIDLDLHKQFGQNTKVNGSIGEVQEATFCNTSNEYGRIEASEIVSINDSSQYDALDVSIREMTFPPQTSEIQFNSIIETALSQNVIIVNAIKNIGTEYKNISKNKITLKGITIPAGSIIPNTPLLIPIKKQVLDSEDVVAVSNIRIPIVSPEILYNNPIAQKKYTADGLIIDNKIALNSGYSFYEQFDDSIEPVNTNKRVHIKHPNNNNISGIRIKHIGDPNVTVRAFGRHAHDEEYTNSLIFDTGQIVPGTDYIALGTRLEDGGYNELTIQVTNTSTGKISYVWFSDIRAERHKDWSTKKKWKNVNDDSTGFSLGIVDGRYYIAESMKVFGDISWNPNFELTIEARFTDGSGDYYTVKGGLADINVLYEKINHSPATVVTDESLIVDPFVQYIRGSSIDENFFFPKASIMSKFSKVYYSSKEQVVDITISLNQLNTSYYDNIESYTMLGHITSITGPSLIEEKEDVSLIISDMNTSKDILRREDYVSNVSISKIYKITDVYFITWYRTPFVDADTGIDIYSFGIYDSINNRHYTPRNMHDVKDYVPSSLDNNISYINILSSNSNNLSFIIDIKKDNDTISLYYNLVSLSEFNGALLYDDSGYRNNKILDVVIIGQDINDIPNTIPTFDTDSSNEDKLLSNQLTIFNSNSDILLKKNYNDQLKYGNGFSFHAVSKYFFSSPLAYIRDNINMASNVTAFPSLLPGMQQCFSNGDSLIKSGDNVVVDDYESVIYFSKLMGMFDFNVFNGLSTFTDGLLVPISGVDMLVSTPSINETSGTYKVLPNKIEDLINVSYNNSLSLAKRIIPIGDKIYCYINNNLYQSSNIKLLPKDDNHLLDKFGNITSSANIIAVSSFNRDSQYSTSIYSMDRFNNANYLASIPDLIISNMIQSLRGLLFVCSNGIYILNQGSYTKLYNFPYQMQYSTIKAMNGKDFIVFAYTLDRYVDIPVRTADEEIVYTADNEEVTINTLGDNFKIFRVNNELGISELEIEDNLSLYEIITSNNTVTDDIVLIENTTNNMSILGFKVENESNVKSSLFSFSTRPINVEDQSDKVYMLEKVYIYTKGYGELGITIKSSDNSIDYTNNTSKLVIGTNDDDELSKNVITIPRSIDMTYKKIDIVADNTLKIDKIKLQGSFKDN